MSRTTSRPAVLLTALALVLGAAACGSNAPSPSGASRSAPDAAAHTGAQALTLTDGWAKAGTGMTGVFGTLTNSSTEPITLTSAASDAASRTELHTMAKQSDGSMKMVRKDGGFTVPAAGVVKLVPGGDHIMLIGLTSELRNGDAVRLTLTSDTGQSFEWSVVVRSFAGAEETYLPGATPTGMSQ